MHTDSGWRKWMKRLVRWRTLVYMIVFIVLLNIGLTSYFTYDRMAGQRLNYKIVERNLDSVDLNIVLDRLADKIKAEKPDKYYIILGDSVPFGGQVTASESLPVWLEKNAKERTGKDVPFYNLSIPSSQAGDIYTLLLMLEKHGINTDNVIMDMRYSSFVARNPWPKIVFWLPEDLRELDPQSYNDILPHLQAVGQAQKDAKVMTKAETYFTRHVLPMFAIYKYRDYIREEYNKWMHDRKNGSVPYDLLGDPRVWNQKEGLKELLSKPEYTDAFSPVPFDLTDKNLNVYFLNKIFEMRKNKNTIVFLGGINDVLMKDLISTPGYIANSKAMNEYFTSKESPKMKYVDLQGVIENTKFTDHVHLSLEGLQELAGILWSQIEQMEGIK